MALGRQLQGERPRPGPQPQDPPLRHQIWTPRLVLGRPEGAPAGVLRASPGVGSGPGGQGTRGGGFLAGLGGRVSQAGRG